MSTVENSIDVQPEREHPLADTDTAREAGHNLVANIARALPENRRTLGAIVRASLPYLLEAGIVAEVVRARPGCLVISASSDWNSGPVQRQPFFTAWIETLPLYTGGDEGTLVPSPHNGDARVYTLLWVPSDGPVQLPLEPIRAPRPIRQQRLELPPASHSLPQPRTPEDGSNGNRPHDRRPVRLPDDPPAQPRTNRVSPPAWLRRRGWMLVVGLIAGIVGGFAMSSMHHSTSYSASTTLFVRSGAGITGPGNANDAEALAVSYAALLPSDQALLQDVSRKLGLSAKDVSSNLSATEEAGTELVNVDYTAATASQALDGAITIANAASSDRHTEGAIAKGSVAVVNEPTTATESKSMSRYGIILGAIFGLMVGAGVALISERSDRRIDDVETLADASDANVTEWPGGLSSLELVRGLGKTGEVHAVTVIPMHEAQTAAAAELAALIDRSGQSLSVTVTPASDTAAWQGDIREAPVVLVVGPGERVRSVRELTERLRLLRADPAWSVLAIGAAGA